MAQAPLGLWHLQGSMQVLSDQLMGSIQSSGGRVLLRHRATALHPSAQGWVVDVETANGRKDSLRAG